MHFGATLRLLRTDAGLTLRALAQHVGVSSAYLSRVENGHDPAPTPDRLAAIARSLGVPPVLLFELARQAGPVVEGYLDRVPAASALFLDIARRNLTAGQLARVKAFIDAELPGPAPAGGRSLRQLVTPGRVILGLDCGDLEDVIDVAASRLPGGGRELARRIRERERDSPTFIGGGVAAPHAVRAGAPAAAVLVTLARPLASATPDGEPLRVAFVLTSPAAGPAQLETLARVARLAAMGAARELAAAATAARALGVVERCEALW